MLLNSIKLQNFRSFKKKSLTFSPSSTFIVGPNTAGKTNILEAIQLLSTGKSFRAGKVEEMIKKGGEISRINGIAKFLAKPDPALRDSSRQNSRGLKSTTTDKLQTVLTKGQVQGKSTPKKIFKINGVEKKWKKFAGSLLTVLFRPEDLNLIIGPPSGRRDFLDSILEQIDWRYRSSNLTYNKGITKRNKLLYLIQKNKAQKSQLAFWDKLLIKNGSYISQKREQMIQFFNNFLSKNSFAKDAGKFINLKIDYQKNGISESRLKKNYKKEVNLAMTIVGPHRDEIKFKVQGSRFKVQRDLNLYGSRGEQRMAVLLLKLAELNYLQTEKNLKPVLLLDDIFSELDQKNEKLVLQLIHFGQTIITTTNIPKKLVLDKSKLIRLS